MILTLVITAVVVAAALYGYFAYTLGVSAEDANLEATLKRIEAWGVKEGESAEAVLAQAVAWVRKDVLKVVADLKKL